MSIASFLGTRHKLETFLPSVALLAGSFATNGASSPSSAQINGKGFTVTRTGTGTYDVVFNLSGTDPVTVAVFATCNTPGGFTVSSTAWIAASAKITITTLVAGVAADVAANANNTVNFHLVFRTAVKR